MSRVVVGLDLSLTATGVARLGGEYGDSDCWTIKSSGKTTDSLVRRSGRLTDLDVQIRASIPYGAFVVVEGPAHGQTSGHHHDRSGLWWLVIGTLIQQGFKVIEVTPQQIKKYGTGRGNASKMEVMASAIKRYDYLTIHNDNEGDAVTAAMLGARLIGQPREMSMPKANLEVVDAILSQGGTP